MRALCILLFLALWLPLNGWGFTVDLKDHSSSKTSAFACMVGQLSGDIKVYQPSATDRFYFINPQRLGIKAPSWFDQDALSANVVLNPKHYKKLFETLRSTFDRHEKGLIVANTAKEAEQLAQYLNQAIPEKKFAPIHALSESGQVNFLVAVKGLDEPKHYPGTSLYLDLNRDVHAESFVRGVSRVLSAEANKRQVDIISLMELSRDNVDNLTASLNRAIVRSKPGQAREELVKLRDSMQMSVKRREIPVKIKTTEEKIDEAIRYLSEHDGVPPQTDPFYMSFQRIRDNAKFIAKLKSHPDEWDKYRKASLRKNSVAPQAKTETYPDQISILMTAHQSIVYMVEWGRMPPRSSALYKRLDKIQNDPVFRQTLKENPKAWNVFEKWEKKQGKELGESAP